MKDSGTKISIKNETAHSATMLMEHLKSKYGSRSVETAIYPVTTFHPPGDRL
jgi:hypothetical protein